MANQYDEKKFAHDWIDDNSGRISAFNKEIWDYAEPAWREYRSAKAYVDLLRAEGFTVEEGSGDMPTAFLATWGEGKPVLGTYAEYDAVPGNCQQVTSRTRRRARACTPGQLATPTPIRCSAQPR